MKLMTKKTSKKTNAKFRQKQNELKAKNQSVQELKVVKTLKKDRKIREAQATPLKTKLTADEKVVRGLRKKLKEVSDLMSKQNEGVELDDQQLKKVGRLSDLMEQMEAYSSR
jgi:hypothetical protein